MNFGKAVGNFFALDIGTSAVRVVELRHSGHGWNLVHYGELPIDVRLSESTADRDKKALGEAIAKVVAESGIHAKDIAIGVPSSKMFASVVEVPNVSKAELNATIKYSAENYVPMKADEAKIDWAVIGQSPTDPNKIEVLVASVLNSFTESRLDLLESLGLNVIAIEPDSLAIARSLVPDGVVDGRLLIDMGDNSTDLVITLGTAPRLIRSVPIGFSTFARMAKQNLNIDQQQAEQILRKFGVSPDKLEGQVARAVSTAVDQFNGEVQKSLKFFASKYTGSSVGAILTSGYALTIPGLANDISDKSGVAVQAATPWQHVNVPAEMQAGLVPISSEFGVAVGLAERLGL